jgi:hypothetical protein
LKPSATPSQRTKTVPLILFSDLRQKNRGRSAITLYESGIHSCIAATLAARIENHIALMGADRLYFRSQALKINLQADDPVKPVGDGAIYGRIDWTAGL